VSLATAVNDAAELLVELVGQVQPTVPAQVDLTAVPVPPAVVVGPPTLAWQSLNPDGEPTEATFPLYYVSGYKDPLTAERFWATLTKVTEALDSDPRTCVLEAAPSNWTAGGTDFPAYRITVEVAL
jgi:hypothetical protein